MKTNWIIVALAFGVGAFFGMAAVYKGEINTINQVMDSMVSYYDSCVPYEQTYEYLFDKVDSTPTQIIRTNYYGREYFTVPVISNCSFDDYVSINQVCRNPFVFSEPKFFIGSSTEVKHD